ncbi:MAG: fumarylacetoacetate hydrolase family protein, partial [Thermoplasmata archaeon]|nr:fumarylacetoacetate hydrolase family protein [Thermoplasmata archaeon]
MEHAKELNNPVPKEPVFFLKPSTSLVPGGGRVELPRGIGRIDHEVELAVVMDDVMNAISPQEAASRIIGYAVFLDLTARDIQSEAKEKGMPWTVAKGYDGFAPISEIMRAEELVKGERAEKKEEEEGERAEALEKEGRAGDMDLELLLEVNGKVRQRGNT